MRNRVKMLISDEFFRHFSIVTLGVGLASFLNLVYQLILVRYLKESQYGTLNSLVALLSFFLAFTQPLRTTLTKFLSGYFSHQEFGKAFYVLRHVFKRLSVISVLLLFIFIFFNSALAAFLNIGNRYYLAIIGIVISLSMITPVFYAFLWSRQLFKILAITRASAVLAKIILGYSLINLGLGISGGLSGYLAVPVLTLSIYLYLIFRESRTQETKLNVLEPVKMGPIYQYFLPTTLALLSFSLLTNIDMILVKHFFSSLDAGYYSVAQIVGKIILFLPGAVYIVIFPKSAALHANNLEGIHLLKKGLLIIAVSCGLLTLITSIFPQAVLRILTAKAPSQSIKLVGLFAITMSFYALVGLINFFHLSRHNTRFVLPIFALALLQTVTIYLYHPTLEAVLSILLFFSILSFVAGLLALKYEGE